MLTWLVLVVLFLLGAGTIGVFMMYVCSLWCASLGHPPAVDPKGVGKGLSASELERLPGVENGETVEGTECAVCLDGIEEGQPARVMPGCRHAFHRGCADSWLSANAVCPMCRNRLLPPPLPPGRRQREGLGDAV